MQNKALRSFFLLLVYFLMLFPVLLVFNDTLTKIMQQFVLYSLLQNGLVPLEIRIVGFIVRPFGISYIALRDTMIVNTLQIRMTWSCLGWQSLLLFCISLIVGLRSGSYTTASKLQTAFLGIFGIFWINIFRISLTVILAVYAMPVFHVVYHDYLAAFTTIFYLLFFWWFAHKYILEEKTRNIH